MTITENSDDRPARDIQLNDRPPVTGPAFSIKSGAFGGEWSSSRGDLTDAFTGCCEDDD
jgi:hypothetical protein